MLIEPDSPKSSASVTAFCALQLRTNPVIVLDYIGLMVIVLWFADLTTIHIIL